MKTKKTKKAGAVSKLTSRMRVYARSAEIRGGDLFLAGRVYSQLPLTNTCFIVNKFRASSHRFVMAIDLEPIPVMRWGLKGWFNWLKHRQTPLQFCHKIEVPWNRIPSSTYSIDFGYCLKQDGQISTPKRQRIRPQSRSVSVLTPVADGDTTLNLFKDDISGAIRLEVFHWGGDALNSLKQYSASGKSADGKVSCIIGELPNTAKENGRWLFEGLKVANLGIDPTYIVERENIGNLNLNQPNVLEYGTVEHIRKCIDTSIIAFTHSQFYIYPNLVKKLSPKVYSSVKMLRLQHGVTALKHTVVKKYKSSGSRLDLATVSSKLEHGILVKRFGYKPEQVKIVGQARYDNLLKLTNKCIREDRILFFPTWRRGYSEFSDERFLNSDYFLEWKSAIKAVRDKTGFKIILIVHPMFERFKDLFEPHVDEVRTSTDFQAELVRSSCLVTDYSSVCFDAIYAGKPVVFYQFDSDDYGFRAEPLIDIDTQMPGPIAQDTDALAKYVEDFQNQGWNADGSVYQKMYFSNIDQNNVKRIAQVIRSAAG